MDVFGGDVGFGLGIIVDCGVKEVIESISVTDAQADKINSQMRGGNGKTWSIDRKTIRFIEDGGYNEANVSARTTNEVTTEIVVRSYSRKVWMSKEYVEKAIKIENQ